MKGVVIMTAAKKTDSKLDTLKDELDNVNKQIAEIEANDSLKTYKEKLDNDDDDSPFSESAMDYFMALSETNGSLSILYLRKHGLEAEINRQSQICDNLK